MNLKSQVRILGIDPGSIVTGYGIIDSDGTHNLHVASGPLRVKAETLPERLKLIFEGITGVILKYHPEVVAIEKVFMNRNADSALKLGQARGAAISAAVMQDLPVSEYTPRHIKQAVVGKGAAAKEQVQHMVKILLNYQGELQSDEADALAVALSHGHIGGTLDRITEASRPTAYKRKHR
ncbi:MAG: crossover junction endodeoxyribonuclease RuvC [Gammaproteobacteria bacterium]|nr:crossover junction endodeoxyribonuclease RuvC [Gammaproteobacteria bacterium]